MSEEVLQSDDLKEIIAANLTHLRQKAGFTQVQLAEALNYSDKAVSKWERGESVPDLRVLIKLSDIYHVSLDDMLKKRLDKRVKPRLNLYKKRLLITLLAMGFVGVVATVVFMIFYYIPSVRNYAYLSFVCMPFVAAIVFTVLSSLWYRRLTMAIGASVVLWSAVLIVHVMLVLFTSIPVWPFYAVAGGIQILIIGWFVLRKLYKPEKKTD